MTIWEAIDKARVERGFSLRKLAKKSGVSENTLIGWIYRGSVPNILLLMQVADALEISLDELIGRKFVVLDKE